MARPSLLRDDVPIVSTADTGHGTRNEALTGVIESQTFLMTGIQISCRVATTGGLGTRIEIVDAIMNVPVATTNVTNGTAVFDLPNSRGSLMIIRLTDDTKSGSIDAWDFQVIGS